MSDDEDSPEILDTVSLRTPTVELGPDSQWGVEEVARVARPAPDPAGPERYEDLGRIAIGGMGELRRIRDRALGRTMVQKILDPSLGADARARFVSEAGLTARLSHPGIAPVHDIGAMADGRLYYMMKEIEGRTFSDVIKELHAVSQERWGRTPDGWTLRRLLDAFHRVCQTIAYAHRRRAMHRDIKPDNLMVGPFGEVVVLDWGLARALAGDAPTERQEPLAEETREEPTIVDGVPFSGRPNDSAWHGGRHPFFHGPGAGRRRPRRARACDRRLLPRRRALHDARRPAALPGRERP